jgi:hypothetical protein
MSKFAQRSLIWPGSHDDDNVAFLLDLRHTLRAAGLVALSDR